jgi:hypothetical protein
MKFKILKINNFSGNAASVYSVVLNNENETLLNKFVRENENLFKSETKEILTRLYSIGHKTGARIQFFKEWEGKPGDGVCALHDDEKSNLRLYCICYGTQIIVVGSGGYKPKTIRALQEDDKLRDENYLLRKISEHITLRIKEKEIRFTEDYLNFIGDLEFNDEE